MFILLSLLSFSFGENQMYAEGHQITLTTCGRENVAQMIKRFCNNQTNKK